MKNIRIIHKLKLLFFKIRCRSFLNSLPFVLLFLPLSSIFAASIYLSPAQKTVNIGDSFSVSVYVESSDQAMNAVSFRLSFPSDLLRVVNVSKSGSIINFWVQEPQILTGEIFSEGVVLNPGYQGSAGKILTINFKALKEGTADLNFISGSVLANDGLGTNILKSLTSGIVKIVKKTIVAQQTPTIQPKLATQSKTSSKDKTPPTIFLKELPRIDLSINTIEIYIEANDQESGIDYYLINLDNLSLAGGKSIISDSKWIDDGSHIYKMTNLQEGMYKMVVKVFDKAGNSNEAYLYFEVKTLEPPTITEFPEEAKTNEPIVIKGKTKYPNYQVDVYLQHIKGGQMIVSSKTDDYGNFAVMFTNVPEGNYRVFAKLKDPSGRESPPSSYLDLLVKSPYLFELFGLSISIFTLIWIFLILMFILVIIALYYVIKLNRLKSSVDKEKEFIHKELHNLMQNLYFRTLEEIRILQAAREKRGLSEEENKILQELETRLEKLSKYFHKEIKEEIKDIEEIFK